MNGYRGRFHPRFYLFDGNGCRGWRRIDSRVRDNGKEFMDAWPRNAPLSFSLGQFFDAMESLSMEGRILAVRTNQQIVIYGDHPPLPSYAASRIVFHDAPTMAGLRPLPLNVTFRNRKGVAIFRREMTLLKPSSISAFTLVFSKTAILRASDNKESDI